MIEKEKYFYAEEDVELYESTVLLTQPFYNEIHDLVLQLIQQYADECITNRSINILDVGAGTGKEAINILNLINNVKIVALDYSQKMINRLKEKLSLLFNDKIIKNKLEIIKIDIRSQQFSSEFLLNQISDTYKYDIIISAFTLHHLTVAEKKIVYRVFYEILNDGGKFINIDLFGYSETALNKLSNDLSKEWMKKQFTNPEPKFKDVWESIAPHQNEQLEKWVKHWDNENLPLAIDTNSKIISNTENNILTEIGFTKIEVPFRYWHTGIIQVIK